MKKHAASEVVAQVGRLSTFSITIAMTMLVVVMGGGMVSAQDDFEQTPPPGVVTILAQDGRIEFPFEIYRGDIRFRCEVNGHPVQMLLDDGYMWDQLLFWGGPEVDSLGRTYDGESEVGNDNSDKRASRTASGITVTFPGVELSEQTAIVTPSSSGVSGMWSGSIGQISAGLFKNFVVEINFDRMTITLTPPEKFAYSGKGKAVPWEPLGFGP